MININVDMTNEISEISTNQIIEILRSGFAIDELRKKALEQLGYIYNLNGQYETFLSEHIKNAQLSGKPLDREYLSPTNSHRDLSDILETANRFMREDILTAREMYYKTQKQLDINKRCEVCFNALSGEFRQILTLLYIKNEKWDYVEHSLRINHSTLVAKRNAALNTIRRLYNSPHSNRYLCRLKSDDEYESRTFLSSSNKKKEKGQCDGQLSLNINAEAQNK